MANPSKSGMAVALVVGCGLTYFLLRQFPDRAEEVAQEPGRQAEQREVAATTEESSESVSAAASHETNEQEAAPDLPRSSSRLRESSARPEDMATTDPEAPKRHLEDKRKRMLEASQRKSKLSSHGGALMSFEGVPYRRLKDHGALSARTTPPAGAVFLQKKGGFAIYRLPPKHTPAPGAAVPLPVFENESNGAFAVWTGQVVVRFKEAIDAARFAQEQNLELVQRFDHLQTAAFRLPKAEDWNTRLALIRRDERVERADADILESPLKPLGGFR